MTVEQTPPFARSDVRRSGDASSARPRRFAAHGHLLTLGAVSWAATQAAFGLNPSDETELAVQMVGGALFQLGLLALLHVLFRTQALGTGPLARSLLRLEAVLVTGAIGATIADGTGVSDMDQVGWALLDAFWPVSMLGMFLIGIRVAVAGRWRGRERYWPMGAESWALVVIPTMGLAGDDAARVVSVVHLCLGYGVLGQLVARKEVSER